MKGCKSSLNYIVYDLRPSLPGEPQNVDYFYSFTVIYVYTSNKG